MCGIAGKIYNSKCDVSTREVEAMLQLIEHRGPNDCGVYQDGRIVIGQKRLSIVDLSADGKQPMSYMNRYQIVFNGEIYNYIELREELRAQGYEFHTKTDTEVLLAAYDYWNSDCLNHFNGMWSFAIWDSKTKVMFCSRDRFGVKPFYYYQTEDGFAFGSEIKEFTVLTGWEAVGNIPRIMDFLLNNGAHDYCKETLFTNVFQLRPGEMLCYDVDCNKVDVSVWYSLEKKKKPQNIDIEEASDRFYELFEDAIRLRLRSDVKVGSCLSGGLDSSSIVCMMNQLLKADGKNNQQEVVFAETHEKKYDESTYAEAVVQKTDVVKHTVQPSYEEIVSKLDKIVWHQDEPFGSTSILAQWDVYEKAREEGLTVMLDGQGADEYLAGYTSFQRAYFRELLLSLRLKKLRKSLKKYREMYTNYYYPPFMDLIDTIVLRLVSGSMLEKIKTRIKHHMGKAVRTDYLIKYDVRTDNAYSMCRKASISVEEETVAEMMYVSLPKLVHHQDRNAMAHSIESRAPFLDYRLVEFVYNLPAEYKINFGVTKYIMRKSLGQIIPERVVNRMDKLGFATPEDIWIRNNKTSFGEMLSSACDNLSGIVNKGKVMADFERQVKGQSTIDSIFWCIICLNTWKKVFNVSIL